MKLANGDRGSLARGKGTLLNPGVSILAQPLTSERPWTSTSTSLSLSFLACKRDRNTYIPEGSDAGRLDEGERAADYGSVFTSPVTQFPHLGNGKVAAPTSCGFCKDSTIYST